MRTFRIMSASLATVALLTFAPGSRAGDGPDPQQFAQHCIQQVSARAAHRVQHNQVTAAQCTATIEALLEQGHVAAAFHVAQHCVHRIVATSHYTQMRNHAQCAQCIQVLVHLGAPGLADVVGNACGEAAQAVGNSRQQAVQAIHDALPEGAAAINTTPCLADLDADRTVGVADLLGLVTAWGTDPEGAPDLDFDGLVTVQDLLVMLQVWGACPQ